MDGYFPRGRLRPAARPRAIMFKLPVPASRLPAMQVHNLVTLASLPPRVRELYGSRWTPAHAAVFRAVLTAPRAARPLSPRCLRVGEHALLRSRGRERAAPGRPRAAHRRSALSSDEPPPRRLHLRQVGRLADGGQVDDALLKRLEGVAAHDRVTGHAALPAARGHLADDLALERR